ncbi:MAG: ubiquinol-cytochrome c reductase iron-sulfur subunit [Deinococcota bacterium]
MNQPDANTTSSQAHRPDVTPDANADVNAAPTAPSSSRRSFLQHTLTWLWRVPVIAALGGGAWAFWLAYRVHFIKPAPSKTPSYRNFDPVTVTSVDALNNVWDSLEFSYAGLPAILVRLPEASSGSLELNGNHYIALSRLCTHQSCLVALKTDPEAIAFAYNFRTDSPALACNCHLSVFSLTQAGRAMSGPARLPLPRIRLEQDGDNIIATGFEMSEPLS